MDTFHMLVPVYSFLDVIGDADSSSVGILGKINNSATGTRHCLYVLQRTLGLSKTTGNYYRSSLFLI